MKCFIDSRFCNCDMDTDTCPNDPFRAMEENDEEQIHLEMITGYHEARRTDD